MRYTLWAKKYIGNKKNLIISKQPATFSSNNSRKIPAHCLQQTLMMKNHPITDGMINEGRFGE
jgi:hypothetical protein